MSDQIADTDLPSMSCLGFERLCVQSWPLTHPLMKLLETHMEMDFEDYRRQTLDTEIPTSAEMRQKWWQQKYRLFVRKQLRALKRPIPWYLPNEAVLSEVYPQIATLWDHKKTNMMLSKPIVDRIDTSRSQFNEKLRHQWLTRRKKQFMTQTLGLKVTTKEERMKSFDYYCRCLLWCRHSKCWWIRIRYFPFNVYLWAVLQTYRFRRPQVFQVFTKKARHQTAVNSIK